MSVNQLLFDNNYDLKCKSITTSGGGHSQDPVVIGLDAAAAGSGAISIGKEAASDLESIAIGLTSTANGQSSVAVGNDAAAPGGQGIAVGTEANANAANSVAIGQQAIANGADSFACGRGAQTTNSGDISIGPFAGAAGVAAGPGVIELGGVVAPAAKPGAASTELFLRVVINNIAYWMPAWVEP